MKKIIYVVLVIFPIILLSPLTFAADRDIVKFQGVVMLIDLKRNLVVVNEKTILLGNRTAVKNEKGSPLTREHLREHLNVGQWVYIEGVSKEEHQRIEANSIFLLPKRIDKKEKHLYPCFGGDGT